MMTNIVLVYPASVAGYPGPCPVKAPCSCDTNTVTCKSLSQAEFPTFTKVNASWDCWTVVMRFNYNIKRIPARGFGNLPICSLTIDQNGFDAIEDGALAGSEHCLYSVFMRSNNFTELPNEIARMSNIGMLSINGNPITKLPEKMSFASTLELFDIGSPEMTSWPYPIQTFKAVWSLTFHDMPMPDLPLNAFDGLENTLTTLSFSSTHMRFIPKAVKKLRKVASLSITNNIELSSEGVADDAFDGLDSLNEILIINSSITQVPNFSKNPLLAHMTLAESPLSQWSEDTLPDQPLIEEVDFSNTEFESIPSAVRHIKSLSSIAFDKSKVSKIGPNDFVGLQKLRQLSFDTVPLSNISIDAFNATHLLQSLNLDHTKISEFPRAIERLPALRFISLYNITIECSCAKLGWLKTWIGIRQLQVFDGQCRNVRMLLAEFIHNELPKCQ